MSALLDLPDWSLADEPDLSAADIRALNAFAALFAETEERHRHPYAEGALAPSLIQPSRPPIVESVCWMLVGDPPAAHIYEGDLPIVDGRPCWCHCSVQERPRGHAIRAYGRPDAPPAHLVWLLDPVTRVTAELAAEAER